MDLSPHVLYQLHMACFDRDFSPQIPTELQWGAQKAIPSVGPASRNTPRPRHNSGLEPAFLESEQKADRQKPEHIVSVMAGHRTGRYARFLPDTVKIHPRWFHISRSSNY